MNSIRIFPDLESASMAAAELISLLAGQSVASRGRFSLALSGGHTPLRLYRILATSPFRDTIPWEAVHVFWGDERCVPASDQRNNASAARRVFLDLVPVPPGHIHPIQSELPPAQAAAQYELELRNYFKEQSPALDLILLGLGADGHAASLFPHTPVLLETKRWAADVFLKDQDMYRVTLTVPLINQAARVVFLASGAEKASALQSVLEGDYDPQMYPAQLIRPKAADPIWLLDKAASQGLRRP